MVTCIEGRGILIFRRTAAIETRGEVYVERRLFEATSEHL